jgi:hypothetical protein
MLKLGVLPPLMQTVQAGQDAVILLALNLLTTFAADGSPPQQLHTCFLFLYCHCCV